MDAKPTTIESRMGESGEAGPYRRARVDVVFTAATGGAASIRIAGHHPVAQKVLDALSPILWRWTQSETRCALSEDGELVAIRVRYHGGRCRTRSASRASVVRIEVVSEHFGWVTWEVIRIRLTWLREITLWSGPGHESAAQKSAAQALAHALGVPLVAVSVE